MDPFESIRNPLSLLGNGSSPDPDSVEERAKQTDQEIVVEGGQEIGIEIPDGADVDRERIEAALSGQGGAVGGQVQGQAGGDTTVTPVASGTDIHITDSAFDLSDWEYKAFLDDKITNLMDNQVSYNQETGAWMLSNDDLIPGILIRLKSILMGEEGLSVDPEDPDSDADQNLADHMEDVYAGESDMEAHVDPQRVVDRVLEQNVMNAVWVGRSPDLQHLDVDDLKYVKDGETGEEIYIQQPTAYTTFEIEDGEADLEVERLEDDQPLVIGEQVLDVRLYRNPPLQAVATDVVNKQQIKRFTGRKAEIASIGGIIIKVNPPAWLDEEDYGNYVRAEDDDFGDEDGRLLELVMEAQIDAALDTLQDYQTATVMSIPENWEVSTVELPEMDEGMQDMIRGYNEAIARRLLLPLDLLELDKGSELSRNTMMSMFVNMIAGWQGQITDMFDKYAQIQADIHGIAGSVDHSLPSVESQDEKELVNLFNFAGLLGLSEGEARELANELEGVDLETDLGFDEMPPEGGPEDPQEREDQMQDLLQQRDQESPESGGNEGPAGGDEGPEPQGAAGKAPFEAATHPDGSIRFGNVGGDPFGDEDVLESFVDALQAAGADQVWLGNEPFGDHSGIHDRPVIASGISVAEAQDVWAEFESDSAALLGPQQVEAALSDEGAIKYGQDGKPICWVCGESATKVNEIPPHEYTCEYHGISPNHVPITSASIEAAKHWEEGEEVELPEGGQGVVVEVRTSNFEGPSGSEVEASEDDPAYVVATVDGSEVFRGGELSEGSIDADVDDPESDLADEVEGFASDLEAAGWMKVHAGPTDWDYPDSWEESEQPARLILLKAWAGMNAQFDCGGDCCKGTMMRNGMSDRASDQFCASMKDRVLMWEGWRKGGASSAPVKASHAFSGFETMREASAHVRDLVEKKTPEGHTTELQKRNDMDHDGFAVIIRDRDGNFQGSMVIREAETEDDQWLVVGGDEFMSG